MAQLHLAWQGKANKATSVPETNNANKADSVPGSG